MIAFLARNPLASGLGILLLVVSIACGVQTLRLAWSQDEVHAEQLKHQSFLTALANESLRVEREAKAKSDKGIEELASEMRSVGLVATQAKTEIRLVQSNGGPCRADPAYVATISGVQRILAAGNPGGDQGKAGSWTAPKVRAANAP